MVNFLFSGMVASVLGMLAGMGVGGGSLLLLWLTQVAGIQASQARLINLLFYLPAALIATLFRRKQNALQLKQLLPAILAGCCAAVAASIASAYVNVELLKKLLGGLLIAIGIREVCYRPRNAR